MRVRVKVGLRLMLNARMEVRGESKHQRLENEFGEIKICFLTVVMTTSGDKICLFC